MLLETLFKTVLDMSITASYVIALVVLLRMLLKKAPKNFSYMLWIIVLFRLLCPMEIESPISVVPQALTQGEVTREIQAQWQEITTEEEKREQSTETISNQPVAIEAGKETQQMILGSSEIFKNMPSIIWILGIVALGVYNLISLWQVRRSLQGAVKLKENIYESDYIKTPFTIGFLNPRIYLPSFLQEEERTYIVMHEQYHIWRKDHIIKAVAYLTLCVYWFNPLVWLAFILAGKDMEMSCDEAVMKKMPNDIRAEYATSLLKLAAGKAYVSAISMTPIGFGEHSVKSRIKHVMNYRKPVVWMSAIAVVLCFVCGMGLMTSPKSNKTGLDEIVGNTYGINAVSYDDMRYSSTYDVEKKISLSTDYILRVYENGEWKYIGEIQPANLSRENFDELFSESNSWVEPTTAKKVRQNSLEAWNVCSDGQVYYILKQKNGNIYLAQGYKTEDQEKTIRWMWTISEVENEQIEKQIIKIDEAVINEEMVTQKYAATLSYADEHIAIFHGYYGLYVYDMQQEQILRSIDLQKLGMYDAEGNCKADIWANEKGNLIYIQKEGSRELFLYDIEQNQMTLEKDSVQSKVDVFEHLRLLSECVGPDYTTARSEYCVPMSDGSYLYVLTGSGMIEDLALVKEKDSKEVRHSSVFQ